jgi:hypothetical protein
MTNSIRLYEGSNLFFSIKTELNISPDFLQMKLAKQYEYRKTTEELWGEINQDGDVKRYELDYYNNNIKEINFK